MKQTLQLRLGQHLTMTPQLQQAIRLLQLSTLDLKEEIQDALDSNLMLETEEEGFSREGESNNDKQSIEAEGTISEERISNGNDTNNEKEINAEANTIPEELPTDSGWDDVYDSVLPAGSGQSSKERVETDFQSQHRTVRTLHDHLTWQLNLSPFSDADLAIATAIIDGINEDGYLTTDLGDILKDLDDEEIGLEEVEAVLHRIQQFDPSGVAARDPRECLLLQITQDQRPHPYKPHAIRLLKEYFELLAQQDHNKIQRKLKLSEQELQETNQYIRSFNPRPGTSISESEPQYVTPDVFVSKKKR